HSALVSDGCAERSSKRRSPKASVRSSFDQWIAAPQCSSLRLSPCVDVMEDAMAKIQHFAAPARVKAPPLSFAARTGDLLFVSGLPGFDEGGGMPDAFEAQFANVVRNLKRVLGEAGADFRDLVKVNVLLTRTADVATMNRLYA